jgi:hypothetical protein
MLVLGDAAARIELGADGVGARDEHHLHDLLVRDAEDGGSVLLPDGPTAISAAREGAA